MTDLHRSLAGRIRHPAALAHERQRGADLQLRLADAITAFAGSMPFVYLHIVAFAVWMLVAEQSPWPQLTLVVSLEAIFLSTFVMIGQNRQGAFQWAKADHDFRGQELELKLNTALTRPGPRARPLTDAQSGPSRAGQDRAASRRLRGRVDDLRRSGRSLSRRDGRRRPRAHDVVLELHPTTRYVSVDPETMRPTAPPPRSAKRSRSGSRTRRAPARRRRSVRPRARRTPASMPSRR